MSVGECLLLLLVAAVFVAIVVRVFGQKSGIVAGVVSLTAIVLIWYFRDPSIPHVGSGDSDADALVTSADCARCHAAQYESWHRTYHRTMTRDATPQYAKGDFANTLYYYQGLPTALTREGDQFFMETPDAGWALRHARGDPSPPRFVKLRIDRFVGSHWIQECFHRAADGTYLRLPVLYHITEKRWVHSNGAFLAPDTEDFWSQCRGRPWNETCLYCHNTEPSKNPVRGLRGEPLGFDTTTRELGIACAACHGPGDHHVRQQSGKPAGENDVVQPAELSVARRDEICARCHGALVPKAAQWDPKTHRDPFRPGQELMRFNSLFWSEAEQAVLAGRRPRVDVPIPPEPNDGRFWGDGTPLTTALEFNGMALSACYQKGNGQLSCLSCHTMHGDDPNYLLKPKMNTNEACYQCHTEYRNRLADHTRHGADSSGSLCYNCHMPHQVYSLLNTHRSHRIQIPDLASSVGTGKPNACNLCHLDKSLGWTRDELAKWPNGKNVKIPKLTQDQELVSEAVRLMCQADARTRAIVAGAFSNPAAHRAAGQDWYGSMLTRLIENERYPAVRYFGHRALRLTYGEKEAGPFDYLGKTANRNRQLLELQSRFDAKPVARPLPLIPLDKSGRPDSEALNRLRQGRNDPDISIHE